MTTIDESQRQHDKMSIAFLSSKIVDSDQAKAEVPRIYHDSTHMHLWRTASSANKALCLPLGQHLPTQRDPRTLASKNSSDTDHLCCVSWHDRVSCYGLSNSPIGTQRTDPLIDASIPLSDGTKSIEQNVDYRQVEQDRNRKHGALIVSGVQFATPQHFSKSCNVSDGIKSSLNTPAGLQGIGQHNDYCQHLQRFQPKVASIMSNPPSEPLRKARPSYSDEQKFFIMYNRIIRGLPWAEIEESFSKFFGLRTQNGLYSVYYRTRKIWKMKDIQSTDVRASRRDKSTVIRMAANFSTELLMEVGYLA